MTNKNTASSQHVEDVPVNDLTEENDSAQSSASTSAQEIEDGENNATDDSLLKTTALELKAAKEKAEENYQRFLRTQADFDNFRRRTKQEKEDLLKYGAAKFIEQFLPVLDNLERALQSGGDQSNHDALIQGLNMVIRQLNGVFDSEGIVAIDQVGVPFDANLHQPMMKVENTDYPSNTVIAILQKGYKLREKVIRPAMVQVN